MKNEQMKNAGSTRNIRLKIPANKATPKPPVGPMLGQHPINLMEFCKEFNNKSQIYKPNTLVPTIVSIAEDKSFKITLKPVPVSDLIKTLKTSKMIDARIIYEIAKIRLKVEDFVSPQSRSQTASLMIKGTIIGMGYKIIGPKDL